MHGPRVHYAKWNKSDRGRQIMSDLPYMWNEKQTKETELRYKEKIGGRSILYLPEKERRGEKLKIWSPSVTNKFINK